MADHRRYVGALRSHDSRLPAPRNSPAGNSPQGREQRRRVPLNQDFLDLLDALTHEGVSFLIVGAHALAVHGVPRATGDLDLWVQPEEENARRVWKALARFGAPLEAFDLTVQDLTRPGTVLQLGLPPRRIDILTEISGVEFNSAWDERVLQQVGDFELPFLGRADLLQNKKESGRPKDLADLAMLEENERASDRAR